MGKAVYKWIWLAFIILGSFNAQAQTTPPLEQKISVELKNVSVKEALTEIEKKANLSFAYRTNSIDQSTRLTRSYVKMSVREVLDDIFQGRLTYKSRGKYVVLKPTPKIEDHEVFLQGYVVDYQTKRRIPYATIFDSVSLQTTISDDYGRYQIQLDQSEDAHLVVKKTGYIDTVVQWAGTGSLLLNIELKMDALKMDSLKREQRMLDKFDWFENILPTEEEKANIINFTEQLRRKAQVSLVPYIGTNGRLSDITSVDYSLNIIGGFNGGVRKAELGGIFNIVWDSVKYFQGAGVFNKVGGYQEGVQVAGVVNINHDSFDGVQSAGICNWIEEDLDGIQLSGIVNRVDGNVDGIQATGSVNVVDGDVVGGQIAGFGNYTWGNVRGFQLAGFMNRTRKDVRGLQLAGFLNTARNVTGTQLGFININRSIDGVPIGFFSYSRKGLHQMELSANELLYANVAFKTGTNQFYNSFLIGTRLGEEDNYWGAGYGIGSSIGFSPKSRLFFDLQGMQLMRDGTEIQANIHGKLTMSFQYQIARRLAVAAGPSMNILYTNSASSEFAAIPISSIYTIENTGDDRLRMWVGGHVAIRLF